MATIINEGGDSDGSALAAVVVIIAAIAVALFAFGAFNAAPQQTKSTDINIQVPPSTSPDSSAPSAPARSTH